MNSKTFLLLSAVVGITLATASAETFDFLGSSSSSWVAYAGASAPTLLTTAPGSITDNPASGSSYGRLDTPFTVHPGSWILGDTFTFRLDGVISNGTTFRAEFTDSAHARALQLVMVNGSANNADIIQVNALGGSSTLLFQGNLGGAGGVGQAQRLTADITLTIQPSGTAALVSGSLADTLGVLWGGSTPTINLGSAPSALYAGINVNAGGGVSGINTLDWSAVPEPSSAVLVGVAGLVGFWLSARGRWSGR